VQRHNKAGVIMTAPINQPAKELQPRISTAALS
jgi:hypothetical protein